MPLLRNARTHELELVADSEAKQAVLSGEYEIPGGAPLQISAHGGQGGVTSAEQLAALEAPLIGQPAAVVADPTQRAQEADAYEAERYGGLAETGAAFTVGVADVATLGAFSALNRATDEQDEVARSVRQHPGAYTAGQVVGAVATGRPTGAAALTPAGQLSRAARAIGTAGEDVGRLGRMGIGALGTGIEGAVQGGGLALADAANADDKFTIESVVSRLPSHVLAGAAGGAAIGAAEKGLSGLVSRSRKAVQAERAAAETAESAPPTAGNVVDDVPDMDLAKVRAAEDAETIRINVERAAERESVVDALTDSRDAAKKEKVWNALEGFKGKESVRTTRAPAPEKPIEIEPPKPKPLSARRRGEAFTVETEGGPASLRLQTKTNSSLDPRWERADDLLGDAAGGQPTTHVRIQKKISGGEWGDIGTATFSHRPEGIGVYNVDVFPAWQRHGLGRRMLEAAENRTGLRVFGSVTPETSTGAALIGKYTASRDLELMAAAEARRQTLPSFARITEVGPVTKSVRLKDLGERAWAMEGSDPARLARVQQGMKKGVAFEPIKVSVDPSGQYSIDDGKARFLAALKSGKKTIRARITQIDNARGAGLGPVLPDAAKAAAKAGKKGAGVQIGVRPELAQEARDLSKISFEADKKIDRLLRNPKALADRPGMVLEALQAEEHALERLSVIDPELRRVMATQKSSGARERALDTLAGRLQRNRTLQERLKAVMATPTTPRLSSLKTQREEIMAGARAPKSLAQRLTEGAVFAGATAAASPLGIGAPIVGAHVAKTVGETFFRRVTKAGANAGRSIAQTAAKLLSGAGAGIRGARPAALPLATKTLAATAFAPAPERGQKRAPEPPGRAREPALYQAYRARSRELQDQVVLGPDGAPVMRPDARTRIADSLVGIAAIAPLMADRLETAMAARVEFLAGKLPVRPDLPGIGMGPDMWRPSEMEMRTFARYVAAAEGPEGVEQRLVDGTITPEDAETYRTLYPERMATLSQRIAEGLPTVTRPLGARQLLSLSLLTDTPMSPALDPRVLTILQAQHEQEPGTEGGTQAPTPQPQFGSVKADPYTPAQERAAK